MTGDQTERLGKESFARFHTVPRRRSRRMREGNEIKRVIEFDDAKGPANGVVQPAWRQKLQDGQFPDRNHQFGLQEADFRFQPRSAIGDLPFVRNAIAAPCFFSRETTADRGHIDSAAKKIFGNSGLFVKPTKKGFSGRPRKGPSKPRFLVTGRLTDEEDAADDGAAGNDRLGHLRTKSAGPEFANVGIEFPLEFRVAHGVAARC
jgi:hypothetical protein